MRMLLTNDDGIDAPGIAALQAACNAFGEAVVVAPDSAHSGCSHRTTTDRPLKATPAGNRRFAVNGAPADCVRLGLLHLAGDVDLVLSGINDGGNLGVDILMSGTVAAAREAALLGQPAVALSHYRVGKRPIDWNRAIPLAERVLRRLAEEEERPPGFWNVNLPHQSDSSEIPAIVRCDPDPHPLPVRYEHRNDAYHYRGDYHNRSRLPQSDVDVCFSGAIALSFVSLRLH